MAHAVRILLFCVVGCGGVSLLSWAWNTPDIPASLSHALTGAGLATVFVAFRRALSALFRLVGHLLHRLRGRRPSVESDLPEPGLVIAGEWATLAVALGTISHLATLWPGSWVLLAILAASAVPLFGFIIAPMLLLLYRRLEAAPDELTSWLREAGGDGGRLDVHVRVYDGELWNAYATGVVPFSRLIIIGRSLLERMSTEQVRAVAAHELGHLRRSHPRLMLPVALVGTSTLVLWNRWSSRLGLVGLDTEFLSSGTLLWSLGTFVVGAVFLGLLPGLLQQRLELEADRFAARMVGPEAVEDALRRLDELTGGAVARGGLTHPPLSKRLENLRRERS
jgi:Zn-dependent protease with chaperone function